MLFKVDSCTQKKSWNRNGIQWGTFAYGGTRQLSVTHSSVPSTDRGFNIFSRGTSYKCMINTWEDLDFGILLFRFSYSANMGKRWDEFICM